MASANEWIADSAQPDQRYVPQRLQPIRHRPATVLSPSNHSAAISPSHTRTLKGLWLIPANRSNSFQARSKASIRKAPTAYRLQGLMLLAEREGFEPSVRLLAQRFSRPPHSTTLAPLLSEGENLGRFQKGSNARQIKIRRRTGR